MDSEFSDSEEQGSGIRQGCTLPPFLFVIALSALVQDAVGLARQARLLLTIPAFNFADVEYADG
eukprot:14747819-Alexandrium_andersonii.AAC.1